MSLLESIAARLEAVRQQQGAKKKFFAHGRLSENTVRNVFKGRDHRLSTLAEIADALDCDVVVSITPRHDTSVKLQDTAPNS